MIRSPHTEASKTPIQPVFAKGIEGRVEVFEEFAEGLSDIEGFSHIYLIFVLDRAGPCRLMVAPYLSDDVHGVFATRAPSRPNAIGISLVRLVAREGSTLRVSDLDILDGTPLLDIKPYSGRFDERDDAICGWLEEVDDRTAGERGLRGYGSEDDAEGDADD